MFYWENQEKLNCLKHAINMLFQKQIVSCEVLQETARSLANEIKLDVNEFADSNTGFFDISVGIKTLANLGFTTKSVLHRNEMKIWRDCEDFIGFIVWKQNHFFCIRKDPHSKKMFVFDSLNPTKTPEVIETVKGFESFVLDVTKMLFCMERFRESFQFTF